MAGILQALRGGPLEGPIGARRGGPLEEWPAWARKAQRQHPLSAGPGRRASPAAPPHHKSKQPLFPADATAGMGLKIDLQSFCSSTAGPAADAGADAQAERPRAAQGRRAGC